MGAEDEQDADAPPAVEDREMIPRFTHRAHPARTHPSAFVASEEARQQRQLADDVERCPDELAERDDPRDRSRPRDGRGERDDRDAASASKSGAASRPAPRAPHPPTTARREEHEHRHGGTQTSSTIAANDGRRPVSARQNARGASRSMTPT